MVAKENAANRTTIYYEVVAHFATHFVYFAGIASRRGSI